jgi:DNA-binding CsgD family transcriptional regulator
MWSVSSIIHSVDPFGKKSRDNQWACGMSWTIELRGSMPTHFSAERTSFLIGMIYDCVIDPALWQGAVDTVRQDLGLATGALSLFDLPSGRMLLNITSGISPEWLTSMAELAHENVALWGGAQRMSGFPLGEPIVNSEIVSPETLAANRYYTEWARPQGLVDAVAIPIARDQQMVGGVGWGVAHPVTECQRATLRLLGPHFRRAISVSNLLDMRGFMMDSLEAALDSFSLGIVLLDADLGIIHTNLAADAMLRESDPISSAGGRLSLPHPRSTEALEDAVRRAASGGMELGQRGMGLPTRRRDGSPVIVHVMPLRRGRRSTASATAAVFVAAATAPPKMPGAALALLYDLTPAETRVLELIVEGKPPTEIGTALGISISTVKTHLVRVFDKTGVHRQADLIRLVNTLTLPL